MPRDNHPRERQARALARKKPKRPPFDRVLIVTEGTKTECLYFEDIRKQRRVSSAHLAIMPSEYGTQPKQVVDFARDQFNKTKEFEYVYAVFDRDEHRTFNEALTYARQLDGTLKNDERKPVRFLAVPSVPCFELWLLLHFEEFLAFTDRHEPIRRLNASIPGYTKGATGIYATTEPHLETAISRAVRLKQRFQPDGGTDPYTDVDLVVQRLRSIRSEN